MWLLSEAPIAFPVDSTAPKDSGEAALRQWYLSERRIWKGLLVAGEEHSRQRNEYIWARASNVTSPQGSMFQKTLKRAATTSICQAMLRKATNNFVKALKECSI